MALGIAVLFLTAVAHSALGREPLPDRETLTKLLDEIDNAAVSMAPCGNPAPGLLKIRHGYDLGYMDQLPLFVGENDGTKRVALDFTCTEGKKWQNPYNGIQYDLPDQITNMVSLPRGIMQFDTYLWKDYNEIKRDWSSNTGLDIMDGAFGFSSSYSRMHHSITAQKKFVEDVTSFVSGFRADYKPPWELKLNAGAQAFIDRFLPNTYEEDMDAWDEFINYYGTHYYEQGNFGGLLKMTMETEKELVFQMGETTTKQNAEAWFKLWIGVLGAHTDTTVRVDARFRNRTSVTQRYFGGQGNLLDRQFYSKWVPTIATNPWLFAGDLKPLSLMFPQAKAAGMNRATQVALNKARVNEMKTAINAYIEDLQNMGFTGLWSFYCNGTRPDAQCDILDMIIITVGCRVHGCRWSNWPDRRDQYVREAQAILPRITAEEARKGRNDAGVATLGRRVRSILLKMNTRSPYDTKTLMRTTQVCYCPRGSRCRCGVNAPGATVKAPRPFFTNWPAR
ncbi:unnamed protein product [Owenia fusiformis]|uniref:Uncharacterized protein n=1 Tax=Owenia fusiformis TaxID=6347 RepID=A0A8J1UB90_OWEFU|nr:unnamed protein product [Owenia fusiformis]